MLKFSIPGKPIANARPRFAKNGRAFDSQKSEKHFTRCIIQQQMAKERILMLPAEPLYVEMTFHTPVPKSWSQKLRKLVLENQTPDPTRKDTDNLSKFYLDCMNDLVYADDRLVTDFIAKKRYSEHPRTEIFISTVEKMTIDEHAITLKSGEENPNLEQLNYMIKKANRIGLNDRRITKISIHKDDEGTHYFFECEQLKQTVPNCS